MDSNLAGVLALAVFIFADFLFLLVAKWLGWEAPRDEEQAEREAAHEEAVLDRERRDPVPRSDAVRLLRRQMPLGLGGDVGASAPGEAWAVPEKRWFATRRGRLRADAYVVAVSALLLAGTAAVFPISPTAAIGIGVAAGSGLLLAFLAIFAEAFQEPGTVEEIESEAAVGRLVSGGGIRARKDGAA